MMHHRTLSLRPRSLAILTTALLSLLFASPDVRADDWASRLGYPAGAKVLVVHAHRMGLCHESNAAVAELMKDGSISSASAMPPCPWFADAVAWRDSHRQTDIGLEFTLNSPLPRYRWRNVSENHLVASLLDRDGNQWPKVMQVMVTATADDVEHELRMQILQAERMGLRPTHLTTHLGALFSRPDLAEVYLSIAREQWIPAVVVDLTPELAERFRQDGFPVPDSLIRTLEAYPLPKVQDLRILPSGGSLKARANATAKMIAGLPPGLTQLACAPATDSPALRALDPNWQQRVWDAEVLNSDAVKKELAKEDVVITNWKEIMKRFEGMSN